MMAVSKTGADGRLSRSRPVLPQTTREKRDRWVGLIIFLWASGGFIPPTASPAERPLTKIIIAYSSISGNMAPLWITYEKGLFRKYGLNVQIVLVEGREPGRTKPRIWRCGLRANGRRGGYPE